MIPGPRLSAGYSLPTSVNPSRVLNCTASTIGAIVAHVEVEIANLRATVGVTAQGTRSLLSRHWISAM